MKKIATLGIALLVALLGCYQQHDLADSRAPQSSDGTTPETSRNDSSANEELERALQQQRSDVQVAAHGLVAKILSDDTNGSRHQRFIVELPSGHTVLVAHNIDLADRIPDLRTGDAVELYGEYVWNDHGGVMHWTHRDPAGRHADGWIKHDRHVYQ